MKTKVVFLIILIGLLIASLIGFTLRRTKQGNNINGEKPTDPASFIEKLIVRQYPAGKITIEETLLNQGNFTSYIFSYSSDNLKIYGLMNIPNGDPPPDGFPVVILNHGYFNQNSFASGDGTAGMAYILAAGGYLTLASDYRGFGRSENDTNGSRGHRPEYAIDVLNLISSVKNLEKANPEKIGMWGHSMGGEVALRTAEATDKIKAIVLWAPTSARVSDNTGASPINYLNYIQAPISLHQGLSDTEVNPKWTKGLNEALLKEGKSVEYFEYEGQDHNFRNLGWDIISKRTIEFFDRYLK